MRPKLHLALFVLVSWCAVPLATSAAQAPVSTGTSSPATASGIKFTRTEDVIYGRTFGTALTLDVFQPERPNGCAIMFMVSGGFSSNHSNVSSGKTYEPFLARGYTVFAIVHGSQPKFHVVEILDHVQRAVRFVRHNAARWGIDPQKFGVTGTSSGGHLSLMLGLRGGPGAADAKDPVERESSAVQAVACFCPPTDFLNWGGPGDDQLGVGEVGAKYKTAWDARIATAVGRVALDKEVSPIHFVSARMAPTLVLHGDADKTVPIYQARSFAKKCAEAGATEKLIERPGKDHNWPEMAADRKLFADWFDQQLRGIAPVAP